MVSSGFGYTGHVVLVSGAADCDQAERAPQLVGVHAVRTPHAAAGVAMQHTLGPVGKPEIERIEHAGRQITGIR
jgi:hypothetical protein